MAREDGLTVGAPHGRVRPQLRGAAAARVAADNLIQKLKARVATLEERLASCKGPRLGGGARVATSQASERDRVCGLPDVLWRAAPPPPPESTPPRDAVDAFLGEVWHCSVLEQHVLAPQRSASPRLPLCSSGVSSDAATSLRELRRATVCYPLARWLTSSLPFMCGSRLCPFGTLSWKLQLGLCAPPGSRRRGPQAITKLYEYFTTKYEELINIMVLQCRSLFWLILLSSMVVEFI